METQIEREVFMLKGKTRVRYSIGGKIISRQRAYQLQQIQMGLCSYCPKKAVVKGYCRRHYDKKLERTHRWQAEQRKESLQKV